VTSHGHRDVHERAKCGARTQGRVDLRSVSSRSEDRAVIPKESRACQGEKEGDSRKERGETTAVSQCVRYPSRTVAATYIQMRKMERGIKGAMYGLVASAGEIGGRAKDVKGGRIGK
jgi:hypothetical protein